ncbi:MAG: hypothetical protein ACI37Z_09700 [Candidatus Gastranaerophilaceae bacterium]
MKKFYKIFLANLLIIILILAAFEIFISKKTFEGITGKNSRISYSLCKENFSVNSIKKNTRKPFGLDKNYQKRPILIYGCSFAYGELLPADKSFGYLLSKKTKRPVYNFAAPARGLQHALYLLENDSIITPEPEYIFYVFISDHARRMYLNCNKIDGVKYIYYHLKDGKMVLQNNEYDLTERFYILKTIKEIIYRSLAEKFNEEIYRQTERYFAAIQEAAKEKYPNAKFVIIDYGFGKDIITGKRAKELNKKGIEIIRLKDDFEDKLKSKEYRISADTDKYKHPNGKAWEIITDYLCKKYNL